MISNEKDVEIYREMKSDVFHAFDVFLLWPWKTVYALLVNFIVRLILCRLVLCGLSFGDNYGHTKALSYNVEYLLAFWRAGKEKNICQPAD